MDVAGHLGIAVQPRHIRVLPAPAEGGVPSGAWYLVAGSLALAWGQGEAALSPWTMGVMFGIGQLLTALILYVTLERTGERSD